MSSEVDPKIIEAIADELVAHGEFSSIPGRNHANAMVAAKAVAEICRRSASPSIGRVGAKALKWGETSYGRPEAFSIVGVYRINEAVNGGWTVAVGGLHGRALEAHDGRKNFASIDAAKAAAQADYEARILSTLVYHEEPAGDTQPKAFIVHDDPELGDYLTKSRVAADASGKRVTPLYAALVSPPDNGEPGNG